GDAPAVEVDLDDADLDLVAGGDDVGWVTDAMVGELAHVDQAIAVDVDVDERAEVGDVRDRPRELHAGPQVLELLDAFGVLEGDGGAAWVARRAGELGEDVAHRLAPGVGADEALGVDAAELALELGLAEAR